MTSGLARAVRKAHADYPRRDAVAPRSRRAGRGRGDVPHAGAAPGAGAAVPRRAHGAAADLAAAELPRVGLQPDGQRDRRPGRPRGGRRRALPDVGGLAGRPGQGADRRVRPAGRGPGAGRGVGRGLGPGRRRGPADAGGGARGDRGRRRRAGVRPAHRARDAAHAALRGPTSTSAGRCGGAGRRPRSSGTSCATRSGASGPGRACRPSSGPRRPARSARASTPWPAKRPRSPWPVPRGPPGAGTGASSAAPPRRGPVRWTTGPGAPPAARGTRPPCPGPGGRVTPSTDAWPGARNGTTDRPPERARGPVDAER